MLRFRTDDDGSRVKLANDVQTGRVAEVGQWIAVAAELRVHIRDRVDAVAPIPSAGSFANAVDALVADLPRFHERLLDLEAVEQSWPDFIGSPNRDAFVVFQHLLDTELKPKVTSR